MNNLIREELKYVYNDEEINKILKELKDEKFITNMV